MEKLHGSAAAPTHVRTLPSRYNLGTFLNCSRIFKHGTVNCFMEKMHRS